MNTFKTTRLVIGLVVFFSLSLSADFNRDKRLWLQLSTSLIKADDYFEGLITRGAFLFPPHNQTQVDLRTFYLEATYRMFHKFHFYAGLNFANIDASGTSANFNEGLGLREITMGIQGKFRRSWGLITGKFHYTLNEDTHFTSTPPGTLPITDGADNFLVGLAVDYRLWKLEHRLETGYRSFSSAQFSGFTESFKLGNRYHVTYELGKWLSKFYIGAGHRLTRSGSTSGTYFLQNPDWSDILFKLKFNFGKYSRINLSWENAYSGTDYPKTRNFTFGISTKF